MCQNIYLFLMASWFYLTFYDEFITSKPMLNIGSMLGARYVTLMWGVLAAELHCACAVDTVY